MATPETRTGQIESAELPAGEERKTAGRLLTAGWWVKRYREMSWAGRFNLIMVILAGLNAAAILIANTLDWRSVVLVCGVIYAAVVLTWFFGFVVFMLLLAIKRFFAPFRTQPPADAGNSAGYDKVQ